MNNTLQMTNSNDENNLSIDHVESEERSSPLTAQLHRHVQDVANMSSVEQDLPEDNSIPERDIQLTSAERRLPIQDEYLDISRDRRQRNALRRRNIQNESRTYRTQRRQMKKTFRKISHMLSQTMSSIRNLKTMVMEQRGLIIDILFDLQENNSNQIR